MHQGTIRFKSRVSERTRKYVSILKRIVTQPAGIRWDFKANFKVYQGKTCFTIFVSG